MASFLYDKGREGFLAGDIDWDTDTIKCMLVDGDYTAVAATHEDLADVPAGGRVGTAATLGTKTVVAGVADAADVTFSAVTNSNDIVAAIIYKDTGSEPTSRLIAYVDFNNITPNGGDITVQWDSGVNKIFKL
tara:strand:+ start:180 stop:578 length:399 start_codon:yes stop_codon:yes gene_type:complete